MISTRRAVVFSIIGTSAFWFGLFVLFAVFSSSGAPPFQVQVEAPDTCYVDKEIQVVVVIGNPNDKAQELESLDLYASFLDGFTVKSIDPVPEEITSVLNFKSYYFRHTLQPNESFKITYNLLPVKAGHFAGDMDLCLPSQKLTTTYLGISIMPKVENEHIGLKVK